MITRSCEQCGGTLISHDTICSRCGARYCWQCGEALFPATAAVKCSACDADWPGPLAQMENWKTFLAILGGRVSYRLVILAVFVGFIAVLVMRAT